MYCLIQVIFISIIISSFPISAEEPLIKPIRTVIDINTKETQKVELTDGKIVSVTLLEVEETRDEIRNALRSLKVSVNVNGQETILKSGNYTLPVTVAGVQIDCPITKGYYTNTSQDRWGLEKDARLRLWPAGSPYITPGTFIYPARQQWFASDTQMSNEPVFVDGGENPSQKEIYYHSGLDIGGPEGMVDILSATDGLVVAVGERELESYKNKTPASPRYDVMYILDDRGWYYRYSHLKSFETNIIPGERVKAGQKIGELGKEGGSGGWSHLHFEIKSRQPSGKWGTEEGYAYLWESYINQYKPPLIAVARPHHLTSTGQQITLDGSKSRSFSAEIVLYEWFLSDGSSAKGPIQKRIYSSPGVYREILKIIDSKGNIDYDFTFVNVIDKSDPVRLPPSIHACYFPTFDIRPGDPVTFKVRSFTTNTGYEIWDFGDGSPTVTTESNPEGNHAEDGYALLIHRFAKKGHYLVRVERTNEHGYKAFTYLHVRVEDHDEY